MLPSRPGDEPGAEDHEDRDPVRDRAEKDRTEKRQRGDDHHTAGELEPRRDDPVGPPRAFETGEQHRREVEDQDVRHTYGRGPEKASNEQRRSADRTNDERLEQRALRIAPHGAERQEDRQDDTEEERSEHRHAEEERARERPRVDAGRRFDARDVVERVAHPEPVEAEECGGQEAHDDEDLAAQRLAQSIAGNRPDRGHDVSPLTASTYTSSSVEVSRRAPYTFCPARTSSAIRRGMSSRPASG